MTNEPTTTHLACLAGGGEMGERMRAFDWAKTSLGPPQSWPQCLRSAVTMMLASRAQIILFWGRDFITLYNDAYRPVFGDKHPRVLGLPGSEAWIELWQSGLKALIEGVVATGEAFWASDRLFVVERFGYREETYFDVSYDPVRDENGAVGGVYCIVNETTSRVLGERRLRTLRELGARTSEGMESAEKACRMATTILNANRYDVPFNLIYLVAGDGRSARLAGAAGLEEGSAAAPREIDLAAPHVDECLWPLGALYRADRTELATGLDERLGPLPGAVWPEPVQRALMLPIKQPGYERPAGFLIAGVNPRRALDEQYRGFFEVVATQIAAAVAGGRAYEEETRRAEALAEIDRAKTAFFANVSHEFRTPLTLMLGPTEDLLRMKHGILPAGVDDELAVVHRNALRLQKLVNTLLDFSRIEANRIQASYEPTDLAALTSELASAFRSAIEKAGMRLIVNCPPLTEPVYVDRDMYEKVLLNLISNAFKFTLEGEIEVTLRDVPPAPHPQPLSPEERGELGCVELCVRDTGTGIDEQQLPHIFERFHRIEGARARTHEGTGIGLALVEELVKLHRGTIRVCSAVGQGSTFIVSIPKGKAHLPADRMGAASRLASTALDAEHYLEEALRWLPADAGIRGQAAGARNQKVGAISGDSSPAGDPWTMAALEGRRSRIVWAEDNADMRDYVNRLLGEHYDVEAVSDGAAALAAVRRQAADMVLADVMMPGLDGFGLLKALRADESTRTMPVMLLSARAGEEARVDGMQAGAADYLVKPFSARELLARVGAQLAMARVRREAAEALRESEARFRHLADHAPVMIWVSDADAARTYLSKSWYEFTGQAADTGLGLGWAEAVHPDDRDYARNTFVAANTKRAALRLEYRLRRQDGQYRWAIDAAAPRMSADGRFLGHVGSIIDITERKQAEEALKQADRRKDEFLATLAHELRNPLAPIRNSLHILRLAGDDSGAAERVHEIMERQVNHLVRLVDDLMEVSRITRGKFELRKERVELAAIVRMAVETSKPLIDAARHQLAISLPAEPLVLEVDHVRIAQVLTNLLNNAAKYTEEEGQIWLSARREGPEVVVSVRDNGIGMPAAMVPKVFDLFTQAKQSYSRAQGGLGIGLTLVRSLVDMHGGSVEARSDGPGKGSEFVVRLPLQKAEARHTRDELREPSPFTAYPSRVLVVDDNRDSADSLATLLKFAGLDVATANDGPAALEAIKTYRPSVVILDIGMPGMDGYEVAQRARQLPEGRDVTLIALTGWGQDEDRRRSKDAGIDHHLVKPVGLGVLEPLLASLSTKTERMSSDG